MAIESISGLNDCEDIVLYDWQADNQVLVNLGFMAN